jgi:uncharacterized membrane protein HdeD (DUF308 family)
MIVFRINKIKMIANLIRLNFSLDNLNRLQGGILTIVVGIIFVIVSKYFHKNYKNQGFKPFKPFRREGKTKSEDYLFTMFYYRTLFSIYLGYFVIIAGIICIIAYFR